MLIGGEAAGRLGSERLVATVVGSGKSFAGDQARTTNSKADEGRWAIEMGLGRWMTMEEPGDDRCSMQTLGRLLSIAPLFRASGSRLSGNEIFHRRIYDGR